MVTVVRATLVPTASRQICMGMDLGVFVFAAATAHPVHMRHSYVHTAPFKRAQLKHGAES